MSSTNELLTDLLDIMFDEKDNLTNENTYLKMCNLIKDIGISCENKYKIANLDNLEFLRASRNKLIMENKKLKKQINS